MVERKVLSLCHPRTHDVVLSNEYRQRGSSDPCRQVCSWIPADEAQDHSDFWFAGMTDHSFSGFFLSKTQVN